MEASLIGIRKIAVALQFLAVRATHLSGRG
jgi:hypothetical protein